MKRAPVVACVLLLLLALPVRAAGVTLKLENATFHQALVKLAEQTHLTFTSLDGAGEPGFQDPSNAPRKSVEWNDAPLARVLRDLCRLYDCSVHGEGPNKFQFLQGDEFKPTVQVNEGLAFYVQRADRTAFTHPVPGPAGSVNRSGADLQLVVRAEDGKPENIGPVVRIAATDPDGKPLPVASPAFPSKLALPDERFYHVVLYDFPAGLRRLRRLDGEVALLNPLEFRRLQLPLPKDDHAMLPLVRQLGRIRVRIMRLTQAADGISLTLRYSGPPDVVLGWLRANSQSLQMREASGKLTPLSWKQRWGVEKNGEDYIEVDALGSSAARAEALELTVPVQDGFARTVPFHLENVSVPPARTEELVDRNIGAPAIEETPDQGPRAFADSKGGTVRLSRLGLSDRRAMRLGIGFSLREANGEWSVIRWMERDVYWDPVRIRALAPGTYRVQVRAAPLSGDGTTGAMRTLTSAEVTVTAGKEVLLTVPVGAPGGAPPPLEEPPAR